MTYAGKNNQTKNVSIGLVHKILKENLVNLKGDKLDE